MDPMQSNQPIQPEQNQTPGSVPLAPSSDPTSLESFIRQSSAEQAWIPAQPLFQGNSSQPQVIEKIVYQKQKVHGFFRTLTILALVVVGFLMLLETLNVFSLSISWFNLNLIYPIFILFSSIVIWSYRGLFWKIFWLILFLIVVGGFFTIWVYTSLNPSTETKFWSYISYPFFSWTSYSKLYINTLVSDLTFMWKKTENFLEGNYGSDRKLLILSWSKENFQYYSIKEETNLNLLQNYYSILSLGVSSTQPLYLYVKNLLALQKIDLSDTLVTTAKVHAAWIISDIIVWSSLNDLNIESALADITLHLPKDIGVKLTYKHLVWQLEIMDFEQKGKWYFESTNIASAQKVVNITMRFGAARTKIVWKE